MDILSGVQQIPEVPYLEYAPPRIYPTFLTSKAKKLHTKYESLHLNQEQQLLKSKQQQLINEKLKNKVYKKNAVAHGSNKKSNPYSKRACSREQAQAKDRVDKPLPIPGNQVNESNIYESVPDGNPHVTETYAQITVRTNLNCI